MNEPNDILLTKRQFFWLLFKTWVIGLSIVAAFFVFDDWAYGRLKASDFTALLYSLKSMSVVFFGVLALGTFLTFPLLVIVGIFVYIMGRKIALHPYIATFTIPLIATPLFGLIMATLGSPVPYPFMAVCFIALSASSAYYAFNLNSKMLGLIDE